LVSSLLDEVRQFNPNEQQDDITLAVTTVEKAWNPSDGGLKLSPRLCKKSIPHWQYNPPMFILKGLLATFLLAGLAAAESKSPFQLRTEAWSMPICTEKPNAESFWRMDAVSKRRAG